ncbi:unnamed protein product [Lactuca saligna]|uniref:Uncharacterized protein n=1 Tax=Lactuca saligna TaxID=75948 RepID=A0AA36E0B9_LACSI|nr:unnamed protein product [Lactuca saligna]
MIVSFSFPDGDQRFSSEMVVERRFKHQQIGGQWWFRKRKDKRDVVSTLTVIFSKSTIYLQSDNLLCRCLSFSDQVPICVVNSNVDLSIFDEKYALLFRDSIAIGDHIMTPLQFQNNTNPNEENVEGKGDSDDINLDDDVEPLFPGFHESSSSNKKRSKLVSNNRSTKNKSSIYEEKVDALLDAISIKSTQTYPQNNPSPTIADCMAIVTKFTKFHEGSNGFSQALFVFTKNQNHEAFMLPTTDEAKIEFLKLLMK